ncbi:FAD-binding protein [Aestuariivirga sp.]|uniref:FAD-binding protein n=1 Tax=Aestuariivirga sp. TaxID=2650926 RepID=UPI0039E3D553
MTRIPAPKDEAELAAVVRDSSEPFRLEGLGTKGALGNPVAASQVLSLRNFAGVVVYEPDELILEAGSATPLKQLEKTLSQKGQMLAFEPPDFSSLLGASTSGSLGGIVACGLSGPRRVRAGAARDHVLGFSGVTGEGVAIRAGARVVKNVTGYDLAKLATGSYGTLVAMTSIIVKVLPKPETEETVFLRGVDDATAMRLMSEAMQSPADVSAAAHLPGDGTYLRLDGIAPSVAARRDRLVKLMKRDAGVLGEKESAKLWTGIRDVKPFWSLTTSSIWRLSVAPTEGASIAAAIMQKLDAAHFYDWAGGLIWLAVANSEDGGESVIRSSFTSGHATLVRAPEAIRARVSAFTPQPAALAALAARVKHSFDARNRFNPGIMVRG